jgi:hypothetical protein
MFLAATLQPDTVPVAPRSTACLTICIPERARIEGTIQKTSLQSQVRAAGGIFAPNCRDDARRCALNAPPPYTGFPGIRYPPPVLDFTHRLLPLSGGWFHICDHLPANSFDHFLFSTLESFEFACTSALFWGGAPHLARASAETASKRSESRNAIRRPEDCPERLGLLGK